MKKIYQTPKTEAVQLLGHSAIMVGSGLFNLYGGLGAPDGMD